MADVADIMVETEGINLLMAILIGCRQVTSLFRAVGDNYQLFSRLISNEIDGHAPFRYRSWQDVPGEHKMYSPHLITILFCNQYHNSEHRDGIKLGIQVDGANRYKDRKIKLKTQFNQEGGYEDTSRAKQNPSKGKITDEMNKAKLGSCGEDTPIDEVKILELSLDHRRGHIRGVGHTVKSVTPDFPLHICNPTISKILYGMQSPATTVSYNHQATYWRPPPSATSATTTTTGGHYHLPPLQPPPPPVSPPPSATTTHDTTTGVHTHHQHHRRSPLPPSAITVSHPHNPYLCWPPPPAANTATTVGYHHRHRPYSTANLF
ncbi:hypothetical protein R6Q57_018084 [Mikania cordata]